MNGKKSKNLDYVSKQHLEKESKKRYISNFNKGNVKSLCIDGFLKSEVAQEVYNFLSEEATFKRIYGIYDSEEPVDREKWERVDDSDRMYTFRRQDGVRDDVSSFRPIKYRRVKDLIAGEAFIGYLEEITGTTLTDLQSFAASAYGVGDFLRPHTDQSGDRKIAYIIYLNPEWHREWGGALHIVDSDANKTEYDFCHNRLVIFDVHDHEHHYIEKIREEAGENFRYTLGGWVNGSA
jgi:Rps23 Pro-64 3,4-dihydroxylase Tpa1-like proline 4-hydroxylase